MKKTYLSHGLLWLGVIGIFFPLFKVLYGYRWNELGYTHAFFILPVSIGLVWWKRKELRQAFFEDESQFSLVSLLIFVSGALIYLFGWNQDYMVVAAFALIPFLYGFIGFVYGRKVRNKLRFPILYLFFLVPPPFALLDKITLPLRYISAEGVEMIFSLFGFPFQREGLMYIVNGKQMMVDSACSGFRSLITMFALGVVYLYLNKSTLLKKLALTASILPLAVLGNILRVIIVSLLNVYFGEEVSSGFLHYFSGAVVFLFIVLGFAGIDALWAEKSKRSKAIARGADDDWF